MSTAAIANPAENSNASTLARFWTSPIGKKVVMAITGGVLFLFVVGHLLGNLQVYLGPGTAEHPARLDEYGRLLRANLGLLWAVRLFLAACAGLHVLASVQLTLMKWAARPVGYRKKRHIGSSYASRTMILSGPMLAAFIVYHLLHFTTGAAHPAFVEGGVYHNVISGFQQTPAAIAYLVAMAFLGYHLVHGVWSAFQSLGATNPRYLPTIRKFATIITALIVLGNISIPISVMLGVLR